jgi:hypothetical protein
MSSTASRGSLSPEQLQEAIATLSSPERVESPFGGMDFFDGVPSADTVTTIYDALDLMRGIEVFLNSMPGASLVAMRRGLRSAGMASPQVIGVHGSAGDLGVAVPDAEHGDDVRNDDARSARVGADGDRGAVGVAVRG